MLGACGQSGPLHHPEPTPAAKATAAAKTAATPAPTGQPASVKR